MDEVLAICVSYYKTILIKLIFELQSFLSLPNKIAVTANLKLSNPTKAYTNHFYILRSHLEWTKGRKAQTHGTAYMLDNEDPSKSTCVAIADGLFGMLSSFL